MDIRGLDPATAKLAIELQLADVDAILKKPSTKFEEYAAFEAMGMEFRSILPLLEDQARARDLIRTDHASEIAFARLMREERQATQDHELARNLTCLGCKRCHSPDPEARMKAQDIQLSHEEYLGSNLASTLSDPIEHIITTPYETQCTLPLLFEYDKSAEHHNVPGASTSSAQRRYQNKGKGKAEEIPSGNEHGTHAFCSACMESHARFDVLELCCKRAGDIANHAYCRRCLADLFRSSLADTTLFPPRCCGVRIPVSACDQLFPPKLVKQYMDKEAELATPDPTYCSNRFCGEFVPIENISVDVATCLKCDWKTCATCKNPKHNGVCPKDPAVQMLMNVAGEQKWQRCYKCRTLVELAAGCYHMRWDEQGLLANSQAIDAPTNRVAMPEVEELPESDPTLDVLNEFNVRLATVAGGFAINSDGEELSGGADSGAGDCAHQWHRVHGEPGELETCNICHSHLKFVNDCTTCGTKVCNRCLNNRM